MYYILYRPDVQLIEEDGIHTSTADVELEAVQINNPKLEQMLKDGAWVDDATGLVPHCLSILKTCKYLSEQLVGMTMGNSQMLRTQELLTEIVTVARRINPRVDEVVQSMYPPLDPRLLEARCTALVLSVSHLVLVTKHACQLSGAMDWIDQKLADIEEHLRILREASLCTEISSRIPATSLDSSDSNSSEEDHVTQTNQSSESEEFSRRDIYLESHIFLDNGASGKEMKDFGIQLLSVIEHNLQVDEQYGTMKYTPYGIQLSWEIPDKMPVFIHIKDTAKVKAKKRWSQVMYMNYILRFRSNYLERASLVKSPFSDSLESLDVGVYMDSSPGSSEESQSNTLRIPVVKFDMGSKTSSYSSLTTFTNVEDKDHELESTASHEKEPSNLDVDEQDQEKQQDELFTEHLYKFDNKSMASSANQDHSIFMISGSEPADLGIVQYDDYVLATDADMSFNTESVLNLVNTCQRNPNVGGVCGRTYPIGVHWHPIVWLQMFDYAKDFWMIKSAQNVIGSVMCCPGCFSLYRFDAIRDVIDTYSEPTTTMEDIFTKDNGEDRWMCTLMMLKGWSLRYNGYGRNSTYCPEETEEFMKQRRRWLLSDFANALVVTKNIGPLMKRNTCFTLLYTLYILQLFIVMILYPGSTIMMLALGFELVTSCPLLANVGFLTALILIYCFVLISSWNPTRKLIVSKLLMIGLGALTLYIFVATAIVIAENMQEDFRSGTLSHLQNFVLVGVAATYIYSALIHPTEIWLLSTGIIYLYYLPLLNILLPLYAVCNIIDQTWGTRDDQVATVPSMLRMPKFKRKRKKKPSIKVRYGSYASLSSSALDLSDTNQSETEFWKHLVQTSVGKDTNLGISQEERNTGLRMLRNRALFGFLATNIVWLALLCGFYEFLISKFEDKTVYGIVIICLLGISPFIQLVGMTVYKIKDMFHRVAAVLS
ncbi:hypothetical protein FSP39_012917 [Pinctada imbricata]|uniref:Transmembrane protein 98 n=1 Tax=Pinctada imbricata TaxID=66713 RepID=A0AA88YD50_PINIB|nr:hypothetical protein FSP39_012917 [Pinctada imbricata]